MAKKSMVLKNERRKRTVERYAKRRAELKALIRNPSTPPPVKADALDKLQSW